MSPPYEWALSRVSVGGDHRQPSVSVGRLSVGEYVGEENRRRESTPESAPKRMARVVEVRERTRQKWQK